jgi:hypothetical protein
MFEYEFAINRLAVLWSDRNGDGNAGELWRTLTRARLEHRALLDNMQPTAVGGSPDCMSAQRDCQRTFAGRQD